MKKWLMLGVFALVGSMAGVALKLVIANHSAASQPPASGTTTNA